MAAPASLSALLDSLTQSLSSAAETAPKVASIEQSTNGISLLDVKNELLLSYLQNLVFLILLKLRNAKNASSKGNSDAADTTTQDVVKKLVELRLYIDKGVRPLEDKLRYQIEKILRAADDAERATQVQAAKADGRSGSEASDSDSESGSESGSDDGAASKAQLSNYSARPDGFVRPAAASAVAAAAQKDGVYRPPRVAPTVMPSERRERKERRPQKSATMDEFIEAEMSSAPMAMPSIGTNVLAGGRKIKTAAERRDEDERREYEESNFVRLPTATKKDKAKQQAQANGRGRMHFGGEEWRDLGEGVDRINRLTAKKEGARGTRALLEKSRKRGRETTDGPKSDGRGPGMGDRFQKRLKVLEAGRRDRGGGRK